MTLPTHTLTTADTARALGLSSERVRQLDAELQPERLPNGQRRYNPDLVVALAQKRAR